jgi:RNA polymerase sigma-70 factor (ECF subfamily)
MDEQQAIQQLKCGDISGLEILVNKYQVRAVRTAYLITRDVALAEDVVQDAFLQAYRSIRHFDQGRPFGPWFLRSVVNAAVKTAQKAARQAPASPASDDSTLEDLLTTSVSVEEQVETAEFQSRVWAAMESLTPRQRAAIVQRYFLDMSEKEIAAELDAAPGTVKWLLHVARERLRSLLSERTEK